MTVAVRSDVASSPRIGRPIDRGWEAAWRPVRDGGHAATSGVPLPAPDLDWIPAEVPGTAAGALRRAGRPLPPDLDETDWWFRTTFEEPAAAPGEAVRLRIAGVSTVATVILNGRVVVESNSMFASHDIDVGEVLAGRNELVIACRGLGPLLREARRPRARWRTKLVDDNAIRWFRTTLTGRAPGFAPGQPIVGPWRPVEIVRWHGVTVDDVRLRARLGPDGSGRLAMGAAVRALGGGAIRRIEARLDGPSGHWAEPLTFDGDAARGEIQVPEVAAWWPHSHGEPALHRVTLRLETTDGDRELALGSVGFRTIEAGPPGHRVDRDGLVARVNRVRTFLRGAVWTGGPELGIGSSPREALQRARDAGLNLLRISGHGAYEDESFHAACDELGILVWQDLAFANLDHPFADPAFRTAALGELDATIERLAAHPSSLVLCGNSEVEQQVAMLGLDAELARDSFYVDEIPARLAAAESDLIAIPSAPTGGDRPFRTDVGIANYYGVGGYRRPLADVRAAGVRFAAESLAFSNLPDDGGWQAAGGTDPARRPAVGSTTWRAGTPRDNGASWDFEDVRDHYLSELYGVDPTELRRSDPERYVELGRLVTGEVMAEVFGEWRRPGSGCGGGLVLWLRDVVPGAGWGLLDHRGLPKVAWHVVRRAWAPLAVWMTDEGLNGIAIHVANDTPDPVDAVLRIATYRDDEVLVDEAREDVRLEPHGAIERDVEASIGRFVDVGWAYRFGPPTASLVVATLETGSGTGGEPISQAFRFPLGRPAGRNAADQAGLDGELRRDTDGSLLATVRSRRYAHGVRLSVPGHTPDDDAFGVEPGHERTIRLVPGPGASDWTGVATLTAANVRGSIGLRLAAVS